MLINNAQCIAFIYLYIGYVLSHVFRYTMHTFDYRVTTVFEYLGEHMSEAFLKVNPFHTVPAIDHDGFTLFER